MLQKILRSEIFIIILLFVGAFAIRSIGIDWGLPGQQFPYSQFNFDEQIELFTTLQLSEGIYQVNLISYQPFFYYFSFLFFFLFFVLGLLTGRFTDLADFQSQYGLDMPQFFIAGRYMMVAVGAVTVVLTYIVGKYMFNKRIGVVAALFLMISFGHTVYSKIFRLDSLLPFVFLLAFFFIIRLREAKPGKLRPYVFAGLVVAAAATTKKTGFAIVVPFLMVPIIEGWVTLKWPLTLRNVDKRFPFGVTVMLAALVALIGPYFVFQRSYRAGTLGAASGLVNDVTRRFKPSIATSNTYALSPYKWSLPWHLSSTLPNELGITIFFMAILGFILMIFDKANRRVILYLAVTLAAFMIPIGVMARAPWRDMLPILPLLAICGGYGFVNMVSIIVRRLSHSGRPRIAKIVAASLLLFIVIPPFVKLVRQQVLTLNTDTRDLAKEWIEENLAPESIIVMEPFGPSILDTSFNESLISSGQGTVESSPDAIHPTYVVSTIEDPARKTFIETEFVERRS